LSKTSPKFHPFKKKIGQKISFLLSKTSPKFHPFFIKKIGQKISFLLSKTSPKFHPFLIKKNWTKNFFSFVKNKSQISPIFKKNLGESVATGYTGYTCNGPVQKPSSIKSKSVWGG